MVETLSTALQNYHINALQEIANQLALKPDRQPAHKSWFVRELTRAIPTLAHSRDFVRSLSEAERMALAVAMKANDACTVREVALPLMLAELVRVDGLPETANRPTALEVLHSLLRKGLIINATEAGGFSTLRTFEPLQWFAVPREVSSALPTSLLPATAITPSSSRRAPATPSLVRAGNPQGYLKQLFFVWAELRREPARRLKAGGLGKRDRRRIAMALGLNDDEGELDQVSRLCEMLAALRMVSEDEETITAVESSAVTLFWNTTLARQMHDLVSAYTRLQAPLGVNPAILSSEGRAGVSPRPVPEMRAIVIKTLGEVAAYDWVSFAWVSALLTGGQAGSFALEPETWDLLYGSLHWYGSSYRLDMEKDLRHLEALISWSIFEELQAIGVVDLGYDSTTPESLSVIRLTPAARAYFEGRSGTDIASEPTGQVVLQPDFQILAMGPVPLRVLASLDQFAEREKVSESVITYRITRDAAYRAFQRGDTAKTILAYLDEATGQPPPQNVMRSLEEWQHQHERIIVHRRVSIMQVDSPELLAQLLADERLRRLLHQLDDRTVWFRVSKLEEVQAQLRALELLPAYSAGLEADVAHSLQWAGDDLVPCVTLPSLYVSGMLSRIAEACNGRWTLTPASVRMATSLGIGPLEIIALLEKMTGAPLSDDWTKRIKSWGNHFGAGTTAQARLLRLERQEALAELRRADARLRRWLHPLPEATNIAAVDVNHWDDVIDLLTSWGVEITSGPWW